MSASFTSSVNWCSLCDGLRVTTLLSTSSNPVVNTGVRHWAHVASISGDSLGNRSAVIHLFPYLITTLLWVASMLTALLSEAAVSSQEFFFCPFFSILSYRIAGCSLFFKWLSTVVMPKPPFLGFRPPSYEWSLCFPVKVPWPDLHLT